MRMAWIATGAIVAGVTAGAAQDTPLIEQLIATNGQIRTVSCDIRREVEIGDSTVTTLSRVWFERSDRLRVETLLPDPRRIVVDGTAIHKWIEGHDEGVRVPLTEAPASERLQVRRVPATGEEYLLRLRGAQETVLPPEEGFPVRRGYISEAPHPYAVVSLDEQGRLARIEFFDPDDRTRRLSRVDFGGWREVAGVWIACQHLSETRGQDNRVIYETLRINRLRINEAIAPENFQVERWAGGVRFLSVEEMEARLRSEENG